MSQKYFLADGREVLFPSGLTETEINTYMNMYNELIYYNAERANEAAEINDRLSRVETTTPSLETTDFLECRVNYLESTIEELKRSITHDLLSEIARRFRDYFSTIEEPVDEEEFYQDLQTLLFGKG